MASAVLAAGLLTASGAWAADFYLASSDAETLTAVDIQSITRQGPVATVRVLMAFASERTAGGHPYDYTINLWSIDCAGRKVSADDIELRNRRHEVITRQTYEDKSWRAAPAGGKFDPVIDAVCDPAGRNPEAVISTSPETIADWYYEEKLKAD